MDKTEFGLEVLTFILLAIGFILMLIAFMMLAALVYRLDDVRLLGESSQRECGVNYMEYETARYKLLQEYRKKKADKKFHSVKKIMFAGLSLVVGGLIVITGINGFLLKGTNLSGVLQFMIGVSFVLGIAIFSMWIAVLGSSKKTITSQYNDNQQIQQKRTKKYLALLTALMAIMVSFCVLTIILQGTMEVQTTNIYIALVLTVFMFVFLYFVEKYHYRIYFEFIKPYEMLSQQVNTPIANLVADTRNRMPSGPYSGKPVKVWMEQLIANNIRRVHPGTESGSAELILAGYGDKYWAYLENQQGKELYELPGNRYVNENRDRVRLYMREMRAKNAEYMKPVRSFTRAIRLLVFTLIFLLIFMLYHWAYMKQPSTIKYIVMLVVVIMTLSLLFSVVL